MAQSYFFWIFLCNYSNLLQAEMILSFLDGGSQVRNKLLKIMNMIFEKGEIPNDFRKTLTKPMYKKGEKSECR